MATSRCMTASTSGITATSASTALWVFLLGSSLLEARHQPVGSVDRHPSENTSGEENTLHDVTHQHTYESKTSMKKD
jgi:hypothetical protein